MAERFGRLLRAYRLRRTVRVRRRGEGGTTRIVAVALSMNELARRAGVDAAHVQRLETGGRSRTLKPVHVTRATALRLAEGLGLDEAETDVLLVAGGFAPVVLAGLTDDRLRSAIGTLWLRGGVELAGAEAVGGG